MKIQLENIGKRYQNEWIFRGVNSSFQQGECIAVHGANGSGKSTLIQILSGFLTPSEGRIAWEAESGLVPIDHVYQHVALATPYMSLYNDFTLEENVVFFRKFKSFRNDFDVNDVIEITGLEKQKNKQLRYYSSGMKQRIKLVLAILSQSSILLLDEPCSHLDEKAILWYQDLLRHNVSDRITFVASNQQHSETFLCERVVAMESLRKEIRTPFDV